MATTPKLVGPADPALTKSFENQTPSVARTSPPTLSANGTATSTGGTVTRSIAPRTSGATTTYNQATQASSGTELFIVSSNNNDANDIVTVYNTEKQISVSAVNQTINNYRVTNSNAYGNSNVAAFLPTYDGNLSSGNLVVSGVSDLGSVANVRIQGGTGGQVLSTNGSGALVWSNDVNLPGGSNTQVQFNDANAFAGNTGFTFNKTTGTLAAPFADVSGVANIVGGGATVATKSVLNVDSAFGSNDANDPASAQAVRGRVTGSNLTKTRNYVTGVTGQYLVTGTNASEFIKAGVLGVVGDQTTTADGAVVAYLDGDGGLTTANAAYAVSMKNSTPNSGFNYGLDLQFINLNLGGVTTSTFKQADIRFNNGVELVANTANNVSINANVTVGNIIATNIGNIANINLTGSNSNVLYGNGVFAPVSGGANTGNWAFVDNTMYNMAGGEINNGDPTHGATSGLILPNNGNAGAVTSLFNTYGNIGIAVANLANSANTSVWSFGVDGNLTLPANTFAVNYANGTAVTIPTVGNIATLNLDGNASNVLRGDGTFSADANSSYGDSNVTSLLGAFGSNTISTTGIITADGANLSNVPYANLTGAPSLGNISNINLDGNVSNLLTGNGTYVAIPTVPTVGNIATLNLDGNVSNLLTGNGTYVAIPVVPSVGNIATLNLDGSNSNVLYGNGVFAAVAGGANTGNVTFNDINIIGTGNLKLQPDSANANAYLDIFLTAGPDIHIAGNGETVILGTDDYANVTVNVNGNVSIQANAGTPYTWTFGTDGNITLPLGSTINNAPDIVTVTLNQFTDGGYPGTQVFNKVSDTLYELSPGGPYMTLISGIWRLKISTSTYYDSTDLVTWSTVAGGLPAPIGSPTAIVTMNLGVGGNVWTFDGDGNLTLPGTASVLANVSITLEANDTGNITGLNLIGDSNANLYAHGNVTIVSDSSNTNATWTFDSSGNLTVPGNLVITGNANVFGIDAALIQQTDGLPIVISSSGANGAVATYWVEDYANASTSNIAAVYVRPTLGANIVRIAVGQNGGNTGPNLWDFGTDGNLTLPGNTVAINFANGSSAFGNIVSTNLDGNVSNLLTGNGTYVAIPTVPTVGNIATLNLDGNSQTWLAGNGVFANIAIPSVGNIATINLDGSNSNVLYGNGVFAAVAGGGNVTWAQIDDKAGNSGPTIIALGQNAGFDGQGNAAIAIGKNAGAGGQGASSITIGEDAGGNTTQGASAIAIGSSAGYDAQGLQAVAIGLYAGTNTQGQYSVAIGGSAGATSQGQESVAVGVNSGSTAQGIGAVSIGASSGASSQGNTSVAIGTSSGALSQGANAVAIGYLAGYQSQGNNSIILNATGANLNQTTANTFTVSPVRNDVSNIAQVMFYNTTSKEVTYGNTISVAGNITGANFIGNLANGNSDVSIPAANGNINFDVAGNANVVVMTGTGANITGTLNVTGNITGNTNGFAIGYLNIPQVAAANATLALTDAGKHYYSTTAGNFTLTVPTNANVAFATGTAVSIVVQAAGNILVNADTGVTLYMAGNSTAANRVVGGYGMATLMKVGTDTWFINGTGVA